MRLALLPLFLLMLIAAAPAPEPKTETAVIATDDAWLTAEVAGDAKFLSSLLLPGYVSIGANGKVTSRSEIVANARARDFNASAKLAAAVADWKALHPAKPEIVIVGDTAILKWVLVDPKAGLVSSSDMFIYRGGRWRAIYSQHTTAAK